MLIKAGMETELPGTHTLQTDHLYLGEGARYTETRVLLSDRIVLVDQNGR